MADKHQIFASIDKAAHASRKALIIMPIVGGVLLLAGIIMFALAEDENLETGGYIFMALGGFFCIVLEGLIYFSYKSTLATAARIKELMEQDPRQLQWAYIHEQRHNNVTTVSVKMHFRDSSEFQIASKLLPEEPHDFLRSLYNINPEIKLGYSEELKKEWMDGGAGPGGETRITKQKITAKRNAAWRWAVPGLALLGVAPLYYSMLSDLEEKGGTIRVKWYVAIIYESMGLNGGTIFFIAIGSVLLLIGIPKLIIAYRMKTNV